MFGNILKSAIIGGILVVLGITVLAYYKEKVPCKEVVYYSIGSFDDKFGITKDQFLEIVAEAEKVWEDQVGRQLFEYSATGTVAINLIYDYRQEATDKLEKAGISIGNDRAAYDSLRSRYDSLTAKYESKKSDFEKAVEEHDEKKENYEERVDYWNDRGGAPPKEYAELEKERKALNAEAIDLKEAQEEINEIVDDINSTSVVLNSLARKLNMKVVKYNEVAENTGEEFSEGEYISDKEGERINVYQFENNTMLERLMKHELGHVLGMDHVKDPDAIMFRLNQSQNGDLTEDDINEIKSVCKI